MAGVAHYRLIEKLDIEQLQLRSEEEYYKYFKCIPPKILRKAEKAAKIFVEYNNFNPKNQKALLELAEKFRDSFLQNQVDFTQAFFFSFTN